MSFGRAFRPVTPTHVLTDKNAPQQEEKEEQTAAADNDAVREQDYDDAQRAAWSTALFGATRPPRSKFSIDTSPESLALLAAAREAATKRFLGDGGGAALDRRYASTHAQPFHSMRPSRPASWETPLADPALSLRRLARIGVERPDLARENASHVAAQEDEERARKARRAEEKFLFREARLGVLHERKRARVLLEQRASLRPVRPAALDASGSSTASGMAPPPVQLRAVDEAQFDPVVVPAPAQAPWDAAHHLARELERAPWFTPAEMAARAVSHIEAKAAVEAETQRRERAARASRVHAVRVCDESMRLENQRRDALISAAFAGVDRVPQNLDAHLTYLASPRCGPRPPCAQPTNVETCRLLPPHRHEKEAHIDRAGWTSIRTHRHFPPGSSSGSGGSGASTARSASNAHAGVLSSRSSAPHDRDHDGTVTSRWSARESGMSSHRRRHVHPDHSGLTSLGESLASSPGVSPRRSSAPVGWAAAASQGKGAMAPRQSEEFRASFAAAVAREEQAQQAAAATAAKGTATEDEEVEIGSSADEEDEDGGLGATERSASQRQRQQEQGSARASRSGRSPRRSSGSRLHNFPPGLDLSVSPRSNTRLGVLLRPAQPPQASPRVERLARPLARLQFVKELDRTHRDFRGLLDQLEPPPLVVQQRREAEEKEKQWRTQMAPSPRPVSALSERPSTARSRFVRDSRVVVPPSDEALISARQTHHAHPPLSSRVSHSAAASARTRTSTSTSAAEDGEAPRANVGAPVQSQLCDPDHRPMWNRTNRLQHCIADLQQALTAR
jgi:hypothetical protein